MIVWRTPFIFSKISAQIENKFDHLPRSKAMMQGNCEKRDSLFSGIGFIDGRDFDGVGLDVIVSLDLSGAASQAQGGAPTELVLRDRAALQREVIAALRPLLSESDGEIDAVGYDVKVARSTDATGSPIFRVSARGWIGKEVAPRELFVQELMNAWRDVPTEFWRKSSNGIAPACPCWKILRYRFRERRRCFTPAR
ncbi:MAG: hypothetical protein ACYCOU_01520 [Sulfobacillus sp.]